MTPTIESALESESKQPSTLLKATDVDWRISNSRIHRIFIIFVLFPKFVGAAILKRAESMMNQNFLIRNGKVPLE